MTATTVANGYPADWKQVSKRVRERAGNRCECMGECGLHKDHPGPRRCVEMNGQPAKWAKGKVMLTAAHLDAAGGPCTCKADTGKKCGIDSHIKAMCQRCHLRMDMPHHVINARNTRAKKKLDRQPLLIEPSK